MDSEKKVMFWLPRPHITDTETAAEWAIRREVGPNSLKDIKIGQNLLLDRSSFQMKTTNFHL